MSFNGDYTKQLFMILLKIVKLLSDKLQNSNVKSKKMLLGSAPGHKLQKEISQRLIGFIKKRILIFRLNNKDWLLMHKKKFERK